MSIERVASAWLTVLCFAAACIQLKPGSDTRSQLEQPSIGSLAGRGGGVSGRAASSTAGHAGTGKLGAAGNAGGTGDHASAGVAGPAGRGGGSSGAASHVNGGNAGNLGTMGVSGRSGTAGSAATGASGHAAVGGTCDAASCGGNLVGEWTIVSGCFDASPASPELSAVCPSATTDRMGTQVSGTVTFNADLTFTHKASYHGSTNLHLTEDCLSQSGATLTCAAFATGGLNCVDENGGCKCSMADDHDVSASGTYSVSGSTLTQLVGSDSETDDFCVQGNLLALRLHDSAGKVVAATRLVLEKVSRSER